MFRETAQMLRSYVRTLDADKWDETNLDFASAFGNALV